MKVSARNLAFPDAVPVYNVVQRSVQRMYNVEHNNQKVCLAFPTATKLYYICTTYVQRSIER